MATITSFAICAGLLLLLGFGGVPSGVSGPTAHLLLARTEGVEPTVPSERMQGNVLAIDHRTGVTTIATDHRDRLVLQFPASAAAQLEQGDPIAVRMAFARYPATMGDVPPVEPTRSETSLKTEKLDGETEPLLVSGIVRQVDRKSGRVDVENGSTMLRVAFDPNTLQDLHEGERISVEMAFSKQIEQQPGRG